MANLIQNLHFKIQNLLTSGNLLEAESLLNEIEPQSELGGLQARWKAKLSIYRNQYSQALQALKEIETNGSQDLSVSADICLCLYQLGFISELNERIEAFKNHITSEVLNQSRNIDFDSALLISKIFEEFGDIKSSQQILKQLEYLHLDSWQNQTITLQKLRQAIELGDRGQIEALYNHLSLGKQPNLGFQLEKEHVLLLASFELFGSHHAFERYQQILNLDLSPADKSFFTSELVEKVLLKKDFEQLNSLALGDLKDSESLYEKIVFEIAQKAIHNQDLLNLPIHSIERELPALSFLRVLRLILKLAAPSANKAELMQLFTLKLKAIPSKELQDQFRRSLDLANSESSLKYNLQTERITFDGRELRVKNKLVHFLLDQLSTHSDISIEAIASDFYNEEHNTQHFDRIRIALYRFNCLVKEELLIDDLFHVTKQGVRIQNQKIEIFK